MWKRLKEWAINMWQALHPGHAVRVGMSVGALVALVIICAVYGMSIRPGLPGVWDVVVPAIFWLGYSVLIGLATVLVLRMLMHVPAFITWVVIAVVVAARVPMDWDILFPDEYTWRTAAVIVLTQAFLFGAIAILAAARRRKVYWFKKTLAGMVIVMCVACNMMLVYYAVTPGTDDYLVEFSDQSVDVQPLAIGNPAEAGSYEVGYLTYGSGTDKRRVEFGADVNIVTETIDVTRFANAWGRQKKLRDWYWGFDLEHAPLNARVWYPQGEGPFPLALIVHGNHRMEHHSDPGYEYLGRLLASRGFILASVDENFLNASWHADFTGENDARAWLLLKHLELFHEWNREEGNPFSGQVDTENIALIGHSRGGEAAAVAATFNKLSHYSEDATIEFDFNFNIKSVVGIAPVDGQYRPAGYRNPLENINYLILQGGHDAQAFFFLGSRQYNRVKFTGEDYHFKASVYNYRSNHSQFNTVWGRYDFWFPTKALINAKPLLEGHEQRQIGKVYISAFLETTLRGNSEYLPLFEDHRRAATWLPDDIYITRFEDSTFKMVAGFDEDPDVTTSTAEGGRISADGLATWREGNMMLRHQWESQENNAVWLGWHRVEAETASYEFELPADAAGEWNITKDSTLCFEIAATEEQPPAPQIDEPNDAKAAVTAKDTSGAEDELLDFSIEFVTTDGVTAKLALSDFRAIPPVLKSRFSKLPEDTRLFVSDTEITLQSFELPLAEFAGAVEMPEFDPARITRIRFVFDRAQRGVIILDRIGFAKQRALQ